NVAHADTPGWRALDMTPFSQTFAAETAVADGLAFRANATRAGHAAPGDLGGAESTEAAIIGSVSPNGNTVSVEDQMVRAAHTKMQHELALGVWRKSLDILRASLGPPR
ncbi:MAG: hypothetical protein AAFU61_01405, partial [Pseudomonadota bacterium]